MRLAKAYLPLVVLVAAVVPAAAESEASTVTIKVGRLATIPVTVDADDVDYLVLGDALDGFREFDASAKKLKIRVIGYEPGTGYVVVSAVKGGKLVPLAVVTVKVTGAPVPPPNPPTPPVPPPNPPTPPVPPTPPADPWVAELRAAFASDAGTPGDKATWKATIVGFFSAMADHARNPAIKTVGDLLADYTSVRASLLPDGALAAVRRLCGAHVAEAAAGADADTPLDPLRDRFAATFKRLAQALDEVK